jgi:hypothetical protein
MSITFSFLDQQSGKLLPRSAAAGALRVIFLLPILTLTGCGTKPRIQNLPLNGPADNYLSMKWELRTRTHIQKLPTGLACVVQADPAPTRTPYGGIVLPGDGAKGFRLDLAFMNPSAIITCYVEAYDAQAKPVARWESLKRLTLPAKRVTYAFVPGQIPSGFRSVGARRREAIDQIHVFVHVVPGKTAGIAMFKAQLLM